jgi:FkbM family methyltransferase
MAIVSTLLRKTRYFLRGGLWLKIIRQFANPQRVFFNILKSGSGENMLQTRSGLKIWVRNNIVDTLIVKEIYIDQPYRTSIPMPANPVAIDIGGYIGDFTLYLAHYLKARVFTCEPIPENYAMVMKNVKANGLENQIRVYHAGAGYGESLTINVSREKQEIHASAFMYADADKVVVPLVSPERIIEENKLDHIDLLKIDCEGMEYELLGTMQDATLQAVRYLVFEWHKIENWEQLLPKTIARLQQLGFTTRQDDKIYHAVNTRFTPLQK